MIEIIIPGKPVAQGRGRAIRTPMGIRVIDPERSRTWKQAAIWEMRSVMGDRKPLEGPLVLLVRAVFELQVSKQRKQPVPESWYLGRPDGDNLLKCAQDAGNGILWRDDSQISLFVAQRIRAAQWKRPEVLLRVAEIVDRPCDWLCTLRELVYSLNSDNSAPDTSRLKPHQTRKDAPRRDEAHQDESV